MKKIISELKTFSEQNLPKADIILLTGSTVIKKKITQDTDVDLILINSKIDDRIYWNTIFNNIEYNITLLPFSKIEKYIQEDIYTRKGILLSMLSKGIIIKDSIGKADQLIQYCYNKKVKGPPKLTDSDKKALRHDLTKLINKLEKNYDSDLTTYLIYNIIYRFNVLVLGTYQVWQNLHFDGLSLSTELSQSKIEYLKLFYNGINLALNTYHKEQVNDQKDEFLLKFFQKTLEEMGGPVTEYCDYVLDLKKINF